jgi:protocatechuate 3,4-dioxygenase beta subunit
VRADTGAPLQDAEVTLSGERLRRVTADDAGRFEFTNLPAGRYNLSAGRPGFVTLQYGGIWSPATSTAIDAGKTLTLADAEVLSDVDFSLPRGGVITGRITDEFGTPVTGVLVRVERYQYGPGGRRLAGFAFGLVQSPLALATNDMGEYRIFGLMPGEYVVSAHLRSSALTTGTAGARDASEGFLPTYFPGTAAATEAQAVRVAAGTETVADFRMVPGRMLRISGTAVNSSGQPARGLNVFLATETATWSAQDNGGPVAADGSFSIGNVPPGDYTLRVRPLGLGGPGMEVASMPITVARSDVTGLRLTTTPGTTIRGHVVWEGSTRRPSGTLRVATRSAEWASGPLGGESTITVLPPGNGAVREDDTFELEGIIGKVLFRPPTLSPLWTLKAVLADGTDITDTGADAASLGGDVRVRIVMTDRITDLTGSVRDGRGQQLSDYVVVLLPQDEMEGVAATRFTRALRPDQNGTFRVSALPPGRYVAGAVASLEQSREWDPAVQRAVRDGGHAFALTEGQALKLSLELLR